MAVSWAASTVDWMAEFWAERMAALRVGSRNGQTFVSWANSTIGLMADWWTERMVATRAGSGAGQTAAKTAG